MGIQSFALVAALKVLTRGAREVKKIWDASDTFFRSFCWGANGDGHFPA